MITFNYRSVSVTDCSLSKPCLYVMKLIKRRWKFFVCVKFDKVENVDLSQSTLKGIKVKITFWKQEICDFPHCHSKRRRRLQAGCSHKFSSKLNEAFKVDISLSSIEPQEFANVINYVLPLPFMKTRLQQIVPSPPSPIFPSLPAQTTGKQLETMSPSHPLHKPTILKLITSPPPLSLRRRKMIDFSRVYSKIQYR